MARATPLYSSFNGGEWSARLHARSDLAKYRNSCRRMQNMIATTLGAATRRPGTRFVAATKANGVARLIAFVFSTVQAYAIEMGDLYFRFFKDRAQILSGGSPYEIVSPYSAAQIAAVKWVQSADILYTQHGLVRPKQVSRTGHTAWTVADYGFRDGPYLDENTDTAKTLTPSATTGAITITAVGHSPFASTDVGRLVRIKHSATWGYAEITSFTSATVVNATVKSNFAAITASAAWGLGAWSDTTGWPGCATFHEERLWFAATATQPQTIWGSRSGDFTNMAPTNVDGTVPADAAIAVTVADDQVNAVRWMVSTAKGMILGTSGGEKIVQASDFNEALTPANVTVRGQASRGTADLMPVRIDRAVLHVERVRRALHEMSYNFEADAHLNPELSLLAGHLTRRGLKELAYQGAPWSVLWAARDDGVLVGLSYLPEHEVNGFHRHPLGGTSAAGAWGKALSVAVVPAAEQDETWLVVERTIDGGTKRYVEFIEDEFWADEEDANQAKLDQETAVFLDSALTYDGWNADLAKTLALSGPGGWNAGDTKTMTAAGHTPFGVGGVGSVGVEYRFRKLGTVFPAVPVTVTGYVSPTEVTVRLGRAAPAALQGAAVDWWAATATTLSGLGHLEGQTVQVLADGGEHPDKVVAAGAVVLERPAAKANVGLACPARLETLDLDNYYVAAGGTARGRPMRVSEATVLFFQTLGAKVGYDDAHLEAVPFRAGDHAMDEPPPLHTGDKRVIWPKGFDTGQRILVTGDRPLPLTVCAIAAETATVD